MTKTVMATMAGTYGHYREAGAVFEITEDRHFSEKWMVPVTSAQAKKLQQAAAAEGEAERHVVDTSVVDNAELEGLRAQLAEANAENERLRRAQKPDLRSASEVGGAKPATGVVSGGGKPSDDRSATDVLAMANDSNVEFMTFKAAARKILGDETPSTKAEIIAALEDKATQP